MGSSIRRCGVPSVLVPAIAAVLALPALLPSAVRAGVVARIRIASRSLTRDPAGGHLFASRGNNIAEIDPELGVLTQEFPMGGAPRDVVVSDDGHYLHAITDDGDKVRRLNLWTGEVDLVFDVVDAGELDRKAVDIAAVPGWPTAVALARRYPDFSPTAGGIVIHADGAELPETAGGGLGMSAGGMVTFGTRGDVLFSYQNDISSFAFIVCAVSKNGVRYTHQIQGLLSGFNTTIIAGEDNVYSNGGVVIDQESLSVVGSLGVGGSVRPDPGAKRVFVLHGQPPVLTISSFDTETLLPLQTIQVPGMSQGGSGLLRYGSNGLAFRTSEEIVLVEEVLLEPAAIREIVAEGSSWKYLDDGSDQGSAWREAGFDDSAWPQGPAKLGYGDGDEATVVICGPSAPACDSQNHITTYFRRRFQVDDVESIAGLVLYLKRDDGAIVYLNGQEIVTDNVAPGASFGAPALETASDDGDGFGSFPLEQGAVALLEEGVNLLAVEIHQASSTSSDISFDLRLVATLEPVTEPLFLRGDPGADEKSDINDAILVLEYLFLGTPEALDCAASADANDDGELNVTDPVYLLRHLFLGGPPLPDPATECAADPTGDSLGCASYPPCD